MFKVTCNNLRAYKNRPKKRAVKIVREFPLLSPNRSLWMPKKPKPKKRH
jgi:hypothetical protein